ncbi:hypothetical protein IWQ60_009160 [Tieghemiomyces parasiticus]|uniref:FAD dependent oxidoreductase domain-containing protein n=1 Tax=Tieghemiomyces parasiticus TaxID=78921 RepID=A0A9W8DLL6_9FUNG|nr:hypothetical protein IWQ60_009160 [Tieghemiomyces parasiticus]
MTSPAPLITTVGGGVTGLTTALVLRRAGYRVRVLAPDYPGMAGNAHFVSPSAGAHWRSWAGPNDTRVQELEATTLRRLVQLASDEPDCGIVPTRSYEFWEKLPPGGGTPAWFKDLVPGFRTLEPSELLPKTVYGITYNKIAINVPVYLSWLQDQTRASGVELIPTTNYFGHIADAFAHAGKTSAVVINCTGLGASRLGGVEDSQVYSIRGQWMLVRAPSAKNSINVTHIPGKIDLMTTIIPRGDGTVFLGGTKEKASEDTTVYKEIADIIWERCSAACPELRQDREAWEARPEPKEPFVLQEGAGLRPGRTGGPRIELEKLDKFVVHNYGHAGYGYQTSWACAAQVLDLIQTLDLATEQ